MRVLIVHKQGPAQFAHLARHLAARGDEVTFLSGTPADIPGVRGLGYAPSRAPNPGTHHYLREAEAAVLNGQAAARRVSALREQGFRPDVVLVHPGWGEALFLRDVLPDARLLTYAEYFHRAEGAEAGFDAETAVSFDARCALHLRNAPLLAALAAADASVSPTRWQRALHPPAFHSAIRVVHEGVDLDEVAPDPNAAFRLDDGRVLTRADEVVTYVSRDLEPVRGFHALMRALPELLRRRPGAQVLVCGADGVSYGRRPPGTGTWRDALTREVALESDRVHFTGWLDRRRFLDLLGVSQLHLYLSAPFVLSWSFTEALAAGCAVLASDTAPVREVVAGTGAAVLVDPREPAAVAERAAALLADPAARTAQGASARALAAEQFNRAECLVRQTALLDELVARTAATAS